MPTPLPSSPRSKFGSIPWSTASTSPSWHRRGRCSGTRGTRCRPNRPRTNDHSGRPRRSRSTGTRRWRSGDHQLRPAEVVPRTTGSPDPPRPRSGRMLVRPLRPAGCSRSTPRRPKRSPGVRPPSRIPASACVLPRHSCGCTGQRRPSPWSGGFVAASTTVGAARPFCRWILSLSWASRVPWWHRRRDSIP